MEKKKGLDAGASGVWRPLFSCRGPVRMAGERGLAHKELAMKVKEKEGEEDDGWRKQKISTMHMNRSSKARSKFNLASRFGVWNEKLW